MYRRGKRPWNQWLESPAVEAVVVVDACWAKNAVKADVEADTEALTGVGAEVDVEAENGTVASERAGVLR